jgi:NAD-dependent SIR2 family protein deacetylase
MGTKIRVFISSTVEDLENERNQVVARVRQLNFEPVNMEGWAASPSPPWERIRKELESCHLFVLILGKRYGYIPTTGAGADDGLSVTHMELRKARELGLPVLPFLKRLKYGSEPDERRDSFRKEVSDWAAGVVVNEFDLAGDLADKVAASLVEVLSDTYLSNAVQERSKSVRVLEPEPEPGGAEPESVNVPPELTRLVARREVVLLAGAGISLAAGYPSARAMTETVQAHLRRELNSPTLALTGMPFQEIASNIEAAFGRGYLLDIFLRAMSGPQGIEPTEAHLASVRLFDKILTTNFDALFEDACRRQNIPHAVVEDYEDLTDTPAGTLVFKLSGSLDRPRTLQITEQDVWNAYGDEPPIWEHLLETVTRSPVLIVGSSLRDTAVKKLCADALSAMRGYIVSPYINEFERLQYQRLGLSPITATADAFFRQLSLEAGAIPAGEPA